jgi:flagellin-specific chaperone FliS
MNGFAAYKKTQTRSTTRIDLILQLFRKAMDNLDRARQALTDGHPDRAQPFLVNTQLIVSALSAELPGYQDENAVNFLRLYEFVAHQMSVATIVSIDAALKVLTPLQEGFEAVRTQAADMEMQGQIPPMREAHFVSLTA